MDLAILDRRIGSPRPARLDRIAAHRDVARTLLDPPIALAAFDAPLALVGAPFDLRETLAVAAIGLAIALLGDTVPAMFDRGAIGADATKHFGPIGTAFVARFVAASGLAIALCDALDRRAIRTLRLAFGRASIDADFAAFGPDLSTLDPRLAEFGAACSAFDTRFALAFRTLDSRLAALGTRPVAFGASLTLAFRTLDARLAALGTRPVAFGASLTLAFRTLDARLAALGPILPAFGTRFALAFGTLDARLPLFTTCFAAAIAARFTALAARFLALGSGFATISAIPVLGNRRSRGGCRHQQRDH